MDYEELRAGAELRGQSCQYAIMAIDADSSGGGAPVG